MQTSTKIYILMILQLSTKKNRNICDDVDDDDSNFITGTTIMMIIILIRNNNNNNINHNNEIEYMIHLSLNI